MSDGYGWLAANAAALVSIVGPMSFYVVRSIARLTESVDRLSRALETERAERREDLAEVREHMRELRVYQ